MQQINENRLINEFIELVKIDSESKNEGQIATVLKKKLQNLQFHVTEDNAREMTGHGANNLVATLKGNIPMADTIFFAAHMDTVSPGNNVQPVIDNDYIRSDGTTILGADDKAGIACLLEMAKVFKEQRIDHGDLQFIFTVGEELGLTGARALDTSLVHATYGYALDSDGTVGNIVIEAPFQAKIFVKIYGKTSHAGVAPEKGISAITVAAKSIAKMKLGRIDKETTANIGYFKGGRETETNVVCDYVEIEAEARSLNKHKLNDTTTSMKQLFQEVARQYGGRAEVTIKQVYPGFSLHKTDRVVKVAQQAAATLGLRSAPLKSGGGSDANILNNDGLPTANLSVGYEHIHTTKEQIKISELTNLTKLIIQITKDVANITI